MMVSTIILLASRFLTHALHLAGMPGMEQGQIPVDRLSLVNHHLAGVLIILLGIFTFADNSQFTSRQKWTKYLWPTPLIALGVYLLFHSDYDSVWTLEAFTKLRDPENAQHKIFALMAVSLGLIELFHRTGYLKSPAWRYLFYGLMFAGGIFLIFHGGHHSKLIHVEHLGMGAVAICIAFAKVLSDWKAGISRWVPLYLLPFLIVLLGLQLVFYFE
jgi:copper resistance protein D